jgi:hypothetical protein
MAKTIKQRLLAHTPPEFCWWCVKPLDTDSATVDHMRPLCFGGSPRDVRNLRWSCQRCNGTRRNEWDGECGWPKPTFIDHLRVAADKYLDAVSRKSTWSEYRVKNIAKGAARRGGHKPSGIPNDTPCGTPLLLVKDDGAVIREVVTVGPVKYRHGLLVVRVRFPAGRCGMVGCCQLRPAQTQTAQP